MARSLQLTIDTIASGGDGVGRTDGLVVFVPRSAPGDEITAAITTKKKQFARGFVESIIHPSPDRIDPPCAHYTRDRCGGCQLQHITYESQLAAKQRMIADAVRRIGKRQDVGLPDIHPSPNPWRYRTKLTLALRWRGGEWIAGLHAYDRPGHVFALEDCPITDTRVVSAWREVMLASKYFPRAEELRGSIRWTDQGPAFVLLGGERWPSHDEFFAAVPSLSALYWEPVDHPRQILGERRGTSESDTSLPAASFAQVNPVVADLLRSHVETRVMSYQPSVVVDGYSGNGDLSVALTRRGVETRAIELDIEAAKWAETRLPAPSKSVCGRVEEVLASQLPADVVVLNPPRAGLHEAVPAILEGETAERGSKMVSPRAIVYVSCDPATLARDIARLPSYRIKTLTAFDMFPQTSHVETVCELVPHSSV